MGNKPVLSLVGLCVSLALSGCKGDGCCGWLFSRKEADPPPVAKVRKTATDEQISRYRTVPDRSTTDTAVSAGPMKKMYDYPADEHSVPAPHQVVTESAAKMTAPKDKDMDRVANDVMTDPLSSKTTFKPVSEKQTVLSTPAEMKVPEPPLSHGDMPVGGGSTAPVDVTRIDPPSYKSSVPAKLPEIDKDVLDPKPAVKDTKAVETIPAPKVTRTVESPELLPPPVKTAAPIDVPGPVVPTVDPVSPAPVGSAPAPLPPSVPAVTMPEVKAPVAPPAVESVSGPEIQLTPPPVSPPAPVK